MNKLLRLFQPAVFPSQIQDPQIIKENYPYWRRRIFYSMFFGYVFYYLTRKSFTFAMPSLIQDLGFDKSQLGLIATLWALIYGLSKFLSGILSDQSDARYFMAFGLIMTGFCNVLFGLSSSFWLFALFWGLNGWFQGFGWPPCARLLVHWYSNAERGSWWASWSVSHNIGGMLIPLLAAICAICDWRTCLYVPGTLSIFAGLLLMERLRDTPQSIGLPPVEEYRNDYSGNRSQEIKARLSIKEILWNYVLTDWVIWTLAITYFFIYTVRLGINDWTALYLIETKHYSQLTANVCVSLFEVGGLLGTLLAGWSSDYLFEARRSPVNVLFAIGTVGSVFFLWSVPQGYVLLDGLAMFLIGLTIFGPQLLIAIIAVEVTNKKVSGTATGFIGGFSYIGSAFTGYPLGKVAQEWGWDGFFFLIALCSLCSLMLSLLLWNIEKQDPVPSTA